MRNIVKQYTGRLDGHLRELLFGASIAFFLKISAAGLSFGLNVVLARTLGAKSSGAFFLVYTIIIIISSIGRIGMENALVRFIASNISANNPKKVLGVYRKAILYSLFTATILSVILYFLAPVISQVVFSKPELTRPLMIMAFAIVPLSLLTLHSNALQGMKKIASSISVLSIFVPFFTCLSAIIFVPRYGLDAVTMGYVLSAAITLIIGWVFWQRAIKPFKTYNAEFESKELLHSSMPLFTIVIMNLIITWSPMLFLGVWESSENIGIYSAASRTSMLTSFVLVAVNSIAAPKFASLYQKKDMKTLSTVAINSTKIMVLFASPVLLTFILIPEFILSLFGEQFVQGATVLRILAFGQFINVSTGSVGYLLLMSGHERLMRNNLFFSSMLGIALNILLIPRYGIIGGAVASAIILSTQNLIAMGIVWKKLGFRTIPWFR